MLEKVRDFWHHGLHVRLYQGLEPVLVNRQKQLVFERRVLIDQKEVRELARPGPVDEWVQQVRRELDAHLQEYVHGGFSSG
ncbi:MAG: hypothetical protein RMJ43_11915 [Chloroherpetonaceae bacterium]|nr:hypothetical protein [Chthonomonadaceae bacterium]MDW8208532.1 hypothetical protein [Chloroherpetonaceae bacterium]